MAVTVVDYTERELLWMCCVDAASNVTKLCFSDATVSITVFRCGGMRGLDTPIPPQVERAHNTPNTTANVPDPCF